MVCVTDPLASWSLDWIQLSDLVRIITFSFSISTFSVTAFSSRYLPQTQGLAHARARQPRYSWAVFPVPLHSLLRKTQGLTMLPRLAFNSWAQMIVPLQALKLTELQAPINLLSLEMLSFKKEKKKRNASSWYSVCLASTRLEVRGSGQEPGSSTQEAKTGGLPQGQF